MAQEDQKSFTDLVRQLVGRCGSDIEKARYVALSKLKMFTHIKSKLTDGYDLNVIYVLQISLTNTEFIKQFYEFLHI